MRECDGRVLPVALSTLSSSLFFISNTFRTIYTTRAILMLELFYSLRIARSLFLDSVKCLNRSLLEIVQS